MGRGKMELKRIENKINRQVTFAKRRNGLLKKAYELSVLCDAEIALLIFSNRGKLYEFCSSPSGMTKTVEKYRKHIYATMDPNQSAKDLQEKYQDYLMLKSKVESLQHSQRHLLGEEIAGMGVNELEQLEHQVDASLKQIRSRKPGRCLINYQTSKQRRKCYWRPTEILGESWRKVMQPLLNRCGELLLLENIPTNNNSNITNNNINKA